MDNATDNIYYPAQPTEVADSAQTPRLSHRRTLLREIVELLVLIVMIYSAVNLATGRYVVEGASMAPNFHTDEAIIVSRFAYMLAPPKRGDVIVFHNPDNHDTDYIKRIVGLPGETINIKDGRVYVNGKMLEEPYIAEFCQVQRCDGTWTVGPDHYFVLGDNRSHSHDGHDFGPLDQNLIVGQAWFRYWPLTQFGPIGHYDYSQN